MDLDCFQLGNVYMVHRYVMPCTDLNFHALLNWAMKQNGEVCWVLGMCCIVAKQLLSSAAGHEEPRKSKDRAFWETFWEGKVTQPHGNAVVFQAVKSIAIHLLCTIACSRQSSSLAWPVSCIQNSVFLWASPGFRPGPTKADPAGTKPHDQPLPWLMCKGEQRCGAGG